MKKLKENIGKEIICTYYRDGIIQNSTFTLNNFEEYQYIEVTTKRKANLNKSHSDYIYFIYYQEFIISIKDANGNIIYENNNPIDILKEIYNLEDLIEKEKLTFGKDYISINEQNSKNYLIQKGLEQILPNLHNKWIRFVEENMRYNIIIIKATISMLEKINSGISFYNAEIEVYRNEFNLSGFATKSVDSAVLVFCNRQKEYCDYLIKMENGTFFENYHIQEQVQDICQQELKPKRKVRLLSKSLQKGEDNGK